MLGKIITALCILHIAIIALLLFARAPVPDLPEAATAEDEYSFTVTSHEGINLFGRELPIAYSGVLTKALVVLSLPALALALLVEGQLVQHTDLSDDVVSKIVGTVALIGVVLQWLLAWLALSGWLRRRRNGSQKQQFVA